ncbi:hypothetical protein NL676_030438 [Syzygium grande]|nr:hypothetical protein NL676_030438 [Syzygium grande]
MEVKIGGGPSLAFESPSATKADDGAGPSKPLDTSVTALMRLDKMGLDKEAIKIGMEMMDPVKLEELKQEWRDLRLSEMALMAKQANLLVESYQLAKTAKK